MPSLPELQAAFAAALAGDGGPDTATTLFRGPPHRVTAGLATYRGNIQGNCVQALRSAYPIVGKIVGDEFFEATAREYFRAHTSVSADLNRYGERLPEFLEGFPHTADLPYLPDVARMEWLAHRAYYAQDAVPFIGATLARTPPERYHLLRPRLAPACALLESAWPLARIWAVHQDDHDGPFEVDLRSGPDRILVERAGWRARVRSLSRGDFRFLHASARGGTLGEALEMALAEDAHFDPSAALACWINAGVITNLDTEDRR